MTRALILIYALASAALYSALMPPWEGFDELYHFGVVQHWATTWRIPEIGTTTLSRELWDSLDFLPVSHYIQPYLERPSTSFEEYFRLTPDQRVALRRSADTMDRSSRYEGSPRENYEAKQAPLTYVLLAPVEAALSQASLPSRVLALRLFLSWASLVLLWRGARRLAACLELQGPLEDAFLLAVFSSQMLYAATCRVGNDALVTPWLAWTLWAAIESFRFPTWRRTAVTAVLMASGFLIKSYLLVFLPLAFAAPAALLFRRRTTILAAAKQAALSSAIMFVAAGPWYARNLLKYRNLTATGDLSGVGLHELFQTAARFPWRKAIPELLRTSLWTGNNSFVTFSKSTLDLVLLLLVIAMVFFAFRARRTFAEGMTVAAVCLYGGLLVLISVIYFRSSNGLVDAAMPWYGQGIVTPLAALAFVGLLRGGRPGSWLAAAAVVLSSYFAAVSWLAKLIPLYGGFPDTHARPAQLVNWYLHSAAQRDSVLSNLCPGPLPVIYFLLGVVLVTLAAALARVVIAILGPGELQSGCKPAQGLLS